MTPIQRTVYFTGVCIGIAAVGVLMLLACAREADAATSASYSFTATSSVASNLHWTLSDWGAELAPGTAYGEVNSFSFYVSGDPANHWLGRMYDLTTSSTTAEIVLGAGSHSSTGIITFPVSGVSMNQTDTYAFVLGNTGGGAANDFDMYGGADPHDGISAYNDTSDGGVPWQTFITTGNVPYLVVNTSPSPTSITITSPENATTTASTTFDITGFYTIGDDLANYSATGELPQEIGLQFLFVDSYGKQILIGPDFSIDSSAGTHSFSKTVTVPQENYSIVGTLVGEYGFIPPPANCTPIPPFTTCTGGNNTSNLVNATVGVVSVANGNVPLFGFQPGDAAGQNALATTTCSITQIGGCFQNALAFLFYPSPDILRNFQFLWGLIKNKPPFGYVSTTITALSTLNASSTPAFSFGDIPLVNTIFTPFRTGLAAILWLGFFIAFYRGRLRHLDI